MQSARHPEARESKQRQQSESPRMLSKMTNREQETGLTPSRGRSILPCVSMSLIHGRNRNP